MRLILMIGVLVLMASSTVARDRALLIGIDDYESPIAKDLEGCENDTKLLRDFLISKFGFKDQDIKTLVNESATEASIKRYVQEWLIDGTKWGDRVFFAYSGHGSRVPDISGDESYDHMDEVIAVYDVSLKEPIIKGKPLFPTSGYILDDEISGWIAGLFGRQVVMLFDSCSSGTISRGSGDAEFASRFLSLKNQNNSRETIYSPDYNISPKYRDANTVNDDFLEGVVNGAVVVSAAKADQESFPIFAAKYGRMQGALTYLFVEKQQERLITVRGLQDTLRLGMEELKQAKLLRMGGNGQYQVPQVEIYGYEQRDVPILAGLSSSGWVTALEIALHNPLSKATVSVGTRDNRKSYSVSKVDESNRLGEMIPLTVSISQAGYLYVWVFSETNVAKCLFPSTYDHKNFLNAGLYTFPRCREGKSDCPPEELYEFAAVEPEGPDLWVALLTEKPLSLRGDDHVYTWAEAFESIGLPAVKAAINKYVKQETMRGAEGRLLRMPVVASWQASSIVLNTHK
jgi:Caspase domain/Domain of unknown function (DUF4384)